MLVLGIRAKRTPAWTEYPPVPSIPPHPPPRTGSLDASRRTPDGSRPAREDARGGERCGIPGGRDSRRRTARAREGLRGGEANRQDPVEGRPPAAKSVAGVRRAGERRRSQTRTFRGRTLIPRCSAEHSRSVVCIFCPVVEVVRRHHRKDGRTDGRGHRTPQRGSSARPTKNTSLPLDAARIPLWRRRRALGSLPSARSLRWRSEECAP